MVVKKTTRGNQKLAEAAKKVTTLNNYEMVLIINPQASEERYNAIIDNLSQYITANGGIIAAVEKWGKKRLAYPIDHAIDGNYVLIRFQLKPEFNREMETTLRITEEIVRYLIVKLES
jgi:small subunit ribosomal protein S6